jgi:hypothetical protein
MGVAEVLERIEGVVIGVLLGFDAGVPLVVFVGNARDAAIPARSLVALGSDAVGAQVALLFEDGSPARPLVIGRIVDPAQRPDAAGGGERVEIRSDERIELRCGAASIVLDSDGRVSIRGKTVTSQASGINRMRGAAVHLN